MRIVRFFILSCVLLNALPAEKLAEFDYAFKSPPALLITGSHYLLGNNTSGEIVLIDRQTLKEIQRFGQIGDGPGEFKRFIGKTAFSRDQIVVNSFRRISFFDAGGNFIRELPTDMGITVQELVGRNLVVQRSKTNERTPDLTTFEYLLCDPELKEIKSLGKIDQSASFEHIELITPAIRA